MQSKMEKYTCILRKNKSADYLSPAQRVFAEYQDNDDRTLVQTTAFVTAPVLVSYVAWILDDAVKQGIKKLYFIARDGYVMKKIAEELVGDRGIALHYLYCSRYVLRQSLFIIDPEDALDKCCISGVRVTAEKVLQRVGLDKTERTEVLTDMQINNVQELLDIKKLNELKQKLRECKLFWKYAEKYAKEQLDLMIDYFVQENFDGIDTAIVDSGWMGTMQSSIQKILSYNTGHKTEITGYYFGMYGQGDFNGTYKCYFFDKSKGLLRKNHFNNTLFECLCSAEHGTTLGYKRMPDRIEPILAKWVNTWNISLQIEICRAYTRIFDEVNKDWNASHVSNINMTDKLFRSFMKHPSKDEAETYGSILFDDDTFENHLVPLANSVPKSELSKILLLNRLRRKIFRIPSNTRSKTSFWLEGCLALSEISPLYRFDFMLQDYIILFMRYIGRLD